VVRRYRGEPEPLVRSADGSWRSGQFDAVLRGDFDLLGAGEPASSSIFRKSGIRFSAQKCDNTRCQSGFPFPVYANRSGGPSAPGRLSEPARAR
jgi:hypothetical protein